MPKKGIFALLLTFFSIFLLKECVSRFAWFTEPENKHNVPTSQIQAADTTRVQKAAPDALSSEREASKIKQPDPPVRHSRHPVSAPLQTLSATPPPTAADTSPGQARQQAEKDLLHAISKKDSARSNTGIPGGYGNNPFDSDEGLGNRKLVSRVMPRDDSQAEGKVCIRICVDALGDVISAAVTARGSTTVDAGLRSKSLAAVQSWKFEPRPGTETQCGTVTFDYILK